MSQEAYIELRRRVDEINQLEIELKKFATEHNLEIGRSRGFPFPLQAADPVDAYDDDGFNDNGINPNNWLYSTVCW